MCMYSAEDGYVNDWYIQHYATRAIGGTGLIIVEATGVLPYVSSITDGDLGIWDDKYIDGLSKLVNAIKSNGGKPVASHLESIQMAGISNDPMATLEQIRKEEAEAAKAGMESVFNESAM